MKNHTLLLIIVALAAFSAPAAAQSLDRFVQVDSVVIAHPPLEFEIRHRIIPYLEKTGFPKDGSQFLEIDSEYFLGSDSPVLLTITAHVRNVWPYAYCEWDPDDWYRPVGYCRIQGYLFMFYDYQNTEVTRRLITPVPWKHRTLKLKSYLPSPYDPDFWCFFISDYSIIFLGSQAL